MYNKLHRIFSQDHRDESGSNCSRFQRRRQSSESRVCTEQALLPDWEAGAHVLFRFLVGEKKNRRECRLMAFARARQVALGPWGPS